MVIPVNHVIDQTTKIKDHGHPYRKISPELFFQTSYRSLETVGAIKSYSKNRLESWLGHAVEGRLGRNSYGKVL